MGSSRRTPLGPVGAAMLGVLCFFGSFGLLYGNEGRNDLSKIAEDAMTLSPQTVTLDPGLQGQLVSVTGEVMSESLVGDDEFLAIHEYLVVNRVVEMYAWDEHVEETSSRSTANDEDTYRYETLWTSQPEDDAAFEYPQGHENPPLPFQSLTKTVNVLRVGQYLVDGKVDLPPGEQLLLTANAVVLEPGETLANSKYIFVGKGSLEEPAIGDVRVSFAVLKPGFTGTLFGALQDGGVVRYVSKDGDKLWRVLVGTRPEAIATLHTEYVTLLWLMRFGGFMLMWFGLASMFGVVSIVLDFIPILGKVGRFVIMLATFPVALALSVFTILISAIVHNVFAVMALGAVFLIGLAMWYCQRSAEVAIKTV